MNRRAAILGGLAFSSSAFGFSLTTAKMWAGLGDSLTAGASGAPGWAWPGQLDALIAPSVGCANDGKLGNLISQIAARYDSFVRSQDYVGAIIEGGINDIIAGTTGADTWTTYEALIDEMLGDGLVVIAMAGSPWSGYSGWTAGKQTQFLALNSSLLGKSATGYHTINLYTGMAAGGDPTALATAYDFGDGLHYNNAGMAYIAAQLAEIVPGLTP